MPCPVRKTSALLRLCAPQSDSLDLTARSQTQTIPLVSPRQSCISSALLGVREENNQLVLSMSCRLTIVCPGAAGAGKIVERVAKADEGQLGVRDMQAIARQQLASVGLSAPEKAPECSSGSEWWGRGASPRNC
eukprot:2433151-Rhodomonas_salina.3